MRLFLKEFIKMLPFLDAYLFFEILFEKIEVSIIWENRKKIAPSLNIYFWMTECLLKLETIEHGLQEFCSFQFLSWRKFGIAENAVIVDSNFTKWC